MKSLEIVVIKDGNAYLIEMPPGSKIFHPEPWMDVDFRIVKVDGELLLSDHVLDMIRKGDKRFRLVGFEPVP
jgi:hypothetical protein